MISTRIFWVQRGLGRRGDEQPLRPDQDQETSERLLKDDVIGIDRHRILKAKSFVFFVKSH